MVGHPVGSTLAATIKPSPNHDRLIAHALLALPPRVRGWRLLRGHCPRRRAAILSACIRTRRQIHASAASAACTCSSRIPHEGGRLACGTGGQGPGSRPEARLLRDVRLKDRRILGPRDERSLATQFRHWTRRRSAENALPAPPRSCMGPRPAITLRDDRLRVPVFKGAPGQNIPMNEDAPPAEQPRNPLHAMTLEVIVSALQAHYGWAELAVRIPVRCFTHDPSISSSLKFLRKSPWAREKVEGLYLFMLREEARAQRTPPRSA